MLTILVVDDLEQDALLVERVIRQARILNPIHHAKSADAAAAYFHAAPPDSEPLLVFVDLIMFPRSGIDLLRMLRPHPLFAESVSIMLTGLGDIRLIQEGYQAGATTFLIKPFVLDDFQHFLAAFRRHIHVDEVAAGKVLRWAERPKRLGGSRPLESPVHPKRGTSEPSKM